MGATGTGKSRLAIDLSLRFGADVINSDKMQVYASLNVLALISSMAAARMRSRSSSSERERR